MVQSTTITIMSDYQSGVQRIDEKFLDTGDVFGLKYNNGYVFLEVMGWTQTKYAPFTGVGEVPANASAGFQRLENSDGDDILYTSKGKNKVKHVALGHSPATVRRYTNYPESENRLRKISNLNAPRSGDDFGYIDGDDSPYSMPTDAEELFIPPDQHLDFDFFNDDDSPHQVVMNIYMRQYNVRPLDPTNTANHGAVRKVVNPGSPAPIGFVGSPDNQARYDLAEDWGVRARDLDFVTSRVN